MKAVRWILIFAFLAVISLVLAGCESTPSLTAIVASPTSLVSPTITLTAKPPTKTPRPTRTLPPPTPTEIIPTATATPEPPSWLVNARPLPDWPEHPSRVQWLDENRIEVSVYDEKEQYFLYDLQTASLLDGPSTTPTHDNLDIEYSSKSTYYVLCSEPMTDSEGHQEFHTLQLFRAQDKKLISQVNNITVTSCFWSVRWATNESILSFVSRKPVCDDTFFCFDIYVWRPNGAQPYVVGQGTEWDEPGTWSPDASRLAVEIRNPDANNPDDEETYLIMYPDGRPPLKTKGQLGVRGMSGVHWLTKTIIYEENNCCVSCDFTDYFIADTGEELTDLSWRSCEDDLHAGNQDAEMSTDQRWFVLDQTNQGILEHDLPFEFTYTLYDFKTRQLYTLSQTDEILIDFVGWSGQDFYLVRRPINDAVAEAADAPFGLIALDPVTRQMRLVDPNIRFAWMSPDATRLFALNKTEEQYTAAIYALNGESLSQPVAISMPQPLLMETVPGLDSRWNLPAEKGPVDWSWSPDGSRIAFRDSTGSLWLIDENGDAQKAAEYLSDPPYSLYDWTSMKRSNTTDLLWSPQSDYLIVRSGNQTWVIDVK